MRASIRILIFAALSVGPAAPAVAQDAVIDPGPDTPAGTQYQIPVDTARQDAAPHPQALKRHHGTTLQSENGFGSSSVVPGAMPAAAKPKARRTPRVHHRRQSTGSRPHGPAPGSAPAAAPVASSASPPASSSSGTGVLVLLLGSVAVAGGVGSAARRRR